MVVPGQQTALRTRPSRCVATRTDEQDFECPTSVIPPSPPGVPQPSPVRITAPKQSVPAPFRNLVVREPLKAAYHSDEMAGA